MEAVAARVQGGNCATILEAQGATKTNTSGKPVAQNYGLLCVHNWLLYGRVAYYFGSLGFPGSSVSGAGRMLDKFLHTTADDG